jgi:hypothetical protein
MMVMGKKKKKPMKKPTTTTTTTTTEKIDVTIDTKPQGLGTTIKPPTHTAQNPEHQIQLSNFN